MLESALIKKMRLVTSAEAFGGTAGPVLLNNHMTGLSANGRPDLELCYRGRLVFIEVKIGGAKLTPLQAVVHCNLKKVGMDVRIVRSIEDYEGILKEIEDETAAWHPISVDPGSWKCDDPACRRCNQDPGG